MRKLLLISLFLFASSATIEFAKETSYDSESNNQFEFTYSGNGYVFVYVSCGTVNNLGVQYGTGNGSSGSISCNKPGVGLLLSPTTETNYDIALKGNKKDSGTIWVNPSTNELAVDLSKKYEGKFSIVTTGSGIEQPPQLTYAINNAEKDVTFNFQYTETDEELRDDVIPNPFKICQESICVTNIKTYDFKKGESYKIHVAIQKVGYNIVLPVFSFADENYKEPSENTDTAIILRFNLWIISLLLLLL